MPPGPFADVPPKHPAYLAGDTLDKMGIPFERMGCSASRTLTRYEFAVAVQRMQYTLRRTVRYIDGDSGPGPDFGAPKGALLLTFSDARKLYQAFQLVEALGREFTPELKLLNDQPEELLSEVTSWRARAGSLAEGLRKIGAPVRSRSVDR